MDRVSMKLTPPGAWRNGGGILAPGVNRGSLSEGTRFNPRARTGRDRERPLAAWPIQTFQSTRPYGARRWRPRGDFGILKWPTLAVCFGPPLDTTNFYSGFEHELGSGGWGWTGEPRWSCSSRFGWSMSLG